MFNLLSLDTVCGALCFAMDHGCHELNDPAKPQYKGTHYDDIPEDRNICHYYQIIPADGEA